MRILKMWVGAEVMEGVLDLGHRQVVGADYDLLRDVVLLSIADPDAPDEVTLMEPRYETREDGRVRMMDPGYSHE